MTTAADQHRATPGAATPSLFPLRGHGVTTPSMDKPFKPYVYGAARSRAAQRALAVAEADHEQRPTTWRGITKEGQDRDPAARLRTYRRRRASSKASAVAAS